jgi:hypothetical protein
MKNLSLNILLIALVLFISSSFCQQDNCIERITQFSTGKDKITFYILDCETNEPLIGAAVYSFNLKKILGMTDIDGIVITEKELKGNLEISYIAYYSDCFRLDDNSIDSIIVRLIPQSGTYFITPVIDTTQKIESSSTKGENDAKLDLNEGKIHLLTRVETSEEQILFAKNHSFEFKVDERDNYYREAYNEVMIDFLNKKFEKNIEEELREICWRIYQPLN